MNYKVMAYMPGYHGKKQYPLTIIDCNTTMEAVKKVEKVFPEVLNVEFL